MIMRLQLLSCPDQCPAKVYSLMHECWAAQPMQRPTFKVRRRVFAAKLFKNVFPSKLVNLESLSVADIDSNDVLDLLWVPM